MKCNILANWRPFASVGKWQKAAARRELNESPQPLFRSDTSSGEASIPTATQTYRCQDRNNALLDQKIQFQLLLRAPVTQLLHD